MLLKLLLNVQNLQLLIEDASKSVVAVYTCMLHPTLESCESTIQKKRRRKMNDAAYFTVIQYFKNVKRNVKNTSKTQQILINV